MSDGVGQELAAEVARRAERHPYAGHPAALILADHELAYWSRLGTLAHCTCGVASDSVGDDNGHASHLTKMLDQAGLLAPPPTVTVEEAAEGDPGMEATLEWFRNGGC